MTPIIPVIFIESIHALLELSCQQTHKRRNLTEDNTSAFAKVAVKNQNGELIRNYVIRFISLQLFLLHDVTHSSYCYETTIS